MSPESSDFNQLQYQEHADTYLESNADGGIGGGTPQERVALVAGYLPKGRSVLEIGSGGGQDAIALQAAGFEVTASDYVPAFVDHLQEQGLKAIHFDAKNDQLVEKFAAIYANAVFVHFSSEEVLTFLKKVREQLTDEKVIFISLIKGEGSERSGRSRGFERDFTYYQLEDISSLANKAGYTLVISKDINDKWLQLILQVSND